MLPDLAGKRADSLVGGDVVREAMTGAAVRVVDVHANPAVGMTRIGAENGAILDLTGDHLILTAGGMIRAGEAMPGTLLAIPGGTSPCIEATSLMGDYKVYDAVLGPEAGGQPCIVANGLVVAAAASR